MSTLDQLPAGRLDSDLDGLLDEAIVIARFIDPDGTARMEIATTEGVDLITQAGLVRWAAVQTDNKIVQAIWNGDEE